MHELLVPVVAWTRSSQSIHRAGDGTKAPGAPPLAEELSVVGGCWGREGQFSLGVWSLVDCPCTTPLNIWVALIRLSEFFSFFFFLHEGMK